MGKQNKGGKKMSATSTCDVRPQKKVCRPYPKGPNDAPRECLSLTLKQLAEKYVFAVIYMVISVFVVRHMYAQSTSAIALALTIVYLLFWFRLIVVDIKNCKL